MCTPKALCGHNGVVSKDFTSATSTFTRWLFVVWMFQLNKGTISFPVYTILESWRCYSYITMYRLHFHCVHVKCLLIDVLTKNRHLPFFWTRIKRFISLIVGLRRCENKKFYFQLLFCYLLLNVKVKGGDFTNLKLTSCNPFLAISIYGFSCQIWMFALILILAIYLVILGFFSQLKNW